MAGLTLDHITKTFTDSRKDVIAVNDVSIDIADGEFLVLVGPSGCGKTTILRMVAGLESLTSGEIRLDGDVINDESPKNRKIAMVFQNYALYPHMTVRENMRFGLEESTNSSDTEIERKVRETAELLDISELLDRKPKELSGGQQQRVALGRAIVRDPAVFLLDEPLSNLDAKLRAHMRTELQRIQEELHVTAVFVTHDQTEAMTMGDRIAVLNDGELQQIGTPLECYHTPANQFVAEFIGSPSMNFFELEVQGSRLISMTANGRFEYPISEETRDAIGDRATVVLGIRPEDIIVSEDRGGEHTFEAVVDVVEPMGNENIVYLTFDSDTMSPDTFIAAVDGFKQISAGEPVIVQMPEDDISIFDAKTGETLRYRVLTDDLPMANVRGKSPALRGGDESDSQ
ncbi:ABC transporter ATP-binding protein [Haladaptatus pallidirubidus]|uniref:ABC-type D-xylose/L-arabinose transporter n=1 Tax=Haladaptatus pallidirubidus TaxID=1008152 RepID=A0AAV3UP81_9EURY|nr:sn-glycerol-3-phosphate ABC transporter ATP-binding protein UgpC [Haladaptatus pallidirubidus]